MATIKINITITGGKGSVYLRCVGPSDFKHSRLLQKTGEDLFSVDPGIYYITCSGSTAGKIKIVIAVNDKEKFEANINKQSHFVRPFTVEVP